MTRKYHSNKITCFFCRYEIMKYNRSKKYVKFKGNFKSICKFCTKSKHKPLQLNYQDVDTQCKICSKPTLFKCCIACSNCDHFYHGKCLNLSRQDIDEIENLAGFYVSNM